VSKSACPSPHTPQHGSNGSVLDGQVLVLNQTYEPLNVTTVRRALRLVTKHKAEVLEKNGAIIHSPAITLEAPSVVRMLYRVKRPLPELKLTRRSVFARDGHKCQYCGRSDVPLTIDHVVPRCRKGATSWSNVVASCIRCNNVKGDRLPKEAGMKLRKTPRRPRYTPYISLPTFLSAQRAGRWGEYLDPWMKCDL
jgi:5-methylcytosine-specific restriction endonuclease McrA